MRLFISWSGPQSNEAAVTIRAWLRHIFPTIDPFLSSDDLRKGTQWAGSLLSGLNQAQHGLFCLTRHNYREPWVLFEAGAIAGAASESKVWTVLIGVLVPENLQGTPLSLFQHTLVKKDDMYRLVQEINDLLETGNRPQQELLSTFESVWPKLETDIARIAGESPMRPKVIRIAEFAQETSVIAGRLFEDTTIRGPAVLLLLEHCSFIDCIFGMAGDIESIFWKPTDTNRAFHVGTIGLSRVTFRRCSFEGVGITGSDEVLDKLRTAVTERDRAS
ncbi:MAG: TIR domain-containing protein [Pseudomonadales bacterium]